MLWSSKSRILSSPINSTILKERSPISLFLLKFNNSFGGKFFSANFLYLISLGILIPSLSKDSNKAKSFRDSLYFLFFLIFLYTLFISFSTFLGEKFF